MLFEKKIPDFSIQKGKKLPGLVGGNGEFAETCQEGISLILEGKKNQEIAQLLNLSVLTVKTHKKNAFRYLKNRLQNLVLLVMIIQISKKISCHNVSG